MPLFTSPREQRLWTLAAITVVAIYATLGLAGIWSEWLRNDDVAAVFFLLGMFLVAVAVVAQGLKTRLRGRALGIVVGVFTVYFMLFFRLTLAERSHLIEYSILAILIYAALEERKKQGGQVPTPAILATLLTTFIGVLDECIQLLLPHRVFDPTDMLFNFLAASMAVATSLIVRWGQQRFRR